MDKTAITLFIMRYLPKDENHPGYWINMKDVASNREEELILFKGLSEESAFSIFERLNLFTRNWLEEINKYD